jgi:WD40 repeat protein
VVDPARPRPFGGPLTFAGGDHVVEALAFSPDGRTLAAAADNTVRLLDLTDPEIGTTKPVASRAASIRR